MDEILSLFERAAALDPTLRASESDLPRLLAKQIHPEPYSRSRLFQKMADAEPVLFTGFEVPIAGLNGHDRVDAVASLFANGFNDSDKARVQTGPSRKKGKMSVREVMKRWHRARGRIGVIDLHIRGTEVEKGLDITGLSDFNLLQRGSQDMAYQEMMTIVICSANNVTDSHTDDPDGSNHCFTGTKLWLVWDTFEGTANGLQDTSREDIEGDQATFDMNTFLTIPSSRWWTVTAGQTHFLPGNMTHKVVTFERYLGIGSFYVSLPNAIASLARWYTHGPNWSIENTENDGLVDDIARHITLHVKKLTEAPEHEREHWGLPQLQRNVARFNDESLLKHAAFAELIETVRSI
ncbi:MAG: hypothetical protein QOE68_877 [Thermoanaerobaculia bacterium]|jgi:hypothetical protein|nr:hypothetical protein [Thermoanaerobaculia bacterium]